MSKPLPKQTGRNDMQTPREILERVERIAPIGLDPCGAPGNPTGAMRYYAPGGRELNPSTRWLGDDGLHSPWLAARELLVFVNPPFGCREGERRSQLYDWVPPTLRAARAGWPVVFLCSHSQRVEVPAFQPLFDVEVLDAVFYPRGRIRYVDPDTGEQLKGTGQWPSMMFFFNIAPTRVARAFGDRGAVLPIGR